MTTEPCEGEPHARNRRGRLDKLKSEGGCLTHVDYPNHQFEEWTYDAAGNKLMHESDQGVHYFDYDAANRPENSGEYSNTYDENGWLVSRQHSTTLTQTFFDYNARGKLLSVRYSDGTSSNYSWYPQSDLRYSATDSEGTTTRFLFDGESEFLSLSATNSALSTITAIPGTYDDRLFERTSDGDLRTYLTDHLNSVRATVSDTSTQTPDQTFAYYAFGGLRSGDPVADLDFGYTGRSLSITTISRTFSSCYTLSMRKIPLGSSDFQRIVSDPDLFYVDKTGFIAEFLQESAEISLMTRPRRFGKTLNLSMLRYFFDQKNSRENRKLFENLKVGQNQAVMSQQGSRPVIALTFKDCKARNWEDMQSMITGMLSEVSLQHIDGAKNGFQEVSLEALLEKRSSYEERCNALKTISSLYPEENKPLILIDEYDVPLQEAWQHGYWEDGVAFFRNFFSAAFKDNPHIWRGVLTGCLRVSRESMFTGLNNLDVFTVSSKTYSSCFGFTQEETVQALEEFGLSNHQPDVENWYNGYRFGDTTIYNPWSISNFLKHQELKPYWVNTSGQQMEKSLLKKSNQDIKQELQILMAGGTITVNLQEQAVFENLESHPENFWNFLYQTGYLKAVEIEHTKERSTVSLRIPNIELMRVYTNSIQSWFIETQSQNAMTELGKALQKGDAEEFSAIFQEIVTQSFSYFDVGRKNPESFYHAFILGMMVQFSNIWQIKSNREAGLGRSDVLLIPKNAHDTTGIIFEFKRRRGKEDLESAAQNALKQIQERQYALELQASGCQKILEIGVGFSGKEISILIKPHFRGPF